MSSKIFSHKFLQGLMCGQIALFGVAEGMNKSLEVGPTGGRRLAGYAAAVKRFCDQLKDDERASTTTFSQEASANLNSIDNNDPENDESKESKADRELESEQENENGLFEKISQKYRDVKNYFYDTSDKVANLNWGKVAAAIATGAAAFGGGYVFSEMIKPKPGRKTTFLSSGVSGTGTSATQKEGSSTGAKVVTALTGAAAALGAGYAAHKYIKNRSAKTEASGVAKTRTVEDNSSNSKKEGSSWFMSGMLILLLLAALAAFLVSSDKELPDDQEPNKEDNVEEQP